MPDFENHKRRINVREAMQEDVAGILEVQKATWLHTYPNEEYGITVEDILSKDFDNPDRTARWRKSMAEGNNLKVWVAQKGKEVIGFCSAMREGNQNRFRAIYILPGFQGKGVGRRLMGKAFDWFGKEKDVVHGVATYNGKAISFYKKLGFQEEVAMSPSPVRRLPSGNFIPEIEMRKPGITR
jgi:GNAT superfamily N-acetyltransferase